MYDEFIWIIVGLTLVLSIYIAINQLRNEIKRARTTLNKIAEKVGALEPIEDDKIKTLIVEGKKIQAIKRYREITGAGLKEAYDYINKLMQ